MAAGDVRGRFERDPTGSVIVEWDGARHVLRSSRGLDHLLRLIEQPGTAIHVSKLMAADAGQGRKAPAEVSKRPRAGLGAALDDRAKQEYKRRIAELEADEQDALDTNDLERATRARVEVDFIVAELTAAVGLGGRDRPQGDDGERARVAVTKALGRAVEGLRRQVPAIAEHLDRTLNRGYECCYDPEIVLLAVGPAPVAAPGSDSVDEPERAPSRRQPEGPRDLGLPRLADLVGRDALVADLVDLVARDARLVTLVGPGGVGKTAIGTAVAAGCAEGFRDGVCFVDLTEAASDADVADLVTRHVDLGLSTNAQALLVLDSAEHVIGGVRPVVEDVMAASPGVVVLVTSRQPLGLQAETVISIEGLRADDARTLFRDAAARAGADVSDVEAAAVVSVVGSLPLVLELAAASLRHLPARVLIERGLDGVRGRDHDDSRHRDLDAVTAWSVRLLDDESAADFSDLSVFHGWFGMDAAAAVLECEPAEAEVRCARLVDRSLLTQQWIGMELRARMLPAIRLHAARRLAATGTTAAVVDRLAQWLIGHMIRRFADPDEVTDAWLGTGPVFDPGTAEALAEHALDQGDRHGAAAVAATEQLPASILGRVGRLIADADLPPELDVGLSLARVHAGESRSRLDRAAEHARSAGNVALEATVVIELGARFADTGGALDVAHRIDPNADPTLARNLAWTCIVGGHDPDPHLATLDRLSVASTRNGAVSRMLAALYRAGERGGPFTEVQASIELADALGVPHRSIDEFLLAAAEAAWTVSAEQGREVLTWSDARAWGAQGLLDIVEVVGAHDPDGAQPFLQVASERVEPTLVAAIRGVLAFWHGDTSAGVDAIDRVRSGDPRLRPPVSLLVAAAAVSERWESAGRAGAHLLRERGDALYRMPVARTVRWVTDGRLGAERHRQLIDDPGPLDVVSARALLMDLRNSF